MEDVALVDVAATCFQLDASSPSVSIQARTVTGVLYHLGLPADWAAAQAAGRYAMSTRGRTLDEEGYIHCSFAEQVAATAARYYGDLDAVLLLHVDEQALTSPVVVEDLVGSGVSFPHVYGPIDLAAVVAVESVDPNRVEL